METNNVENSEEDRFVNSLTHQIEREDALVNTRLTWMLTTQGFLFASLAIIADADKVREEMYDILKLVLPFTGLALSIISYYGIRGANIALCELKGKWLVKHEENFLRPFGNPKASNFGEVPSKWLPWLFALVWLVVLVSQFVLPEQPR